MGFFAWFADCLLHRPGKDKDMPVPRYLLLSILMSLLLFTSMAANAQGQTFLFSGSYTGTITLTPTSPTTYQASSAARVPPPR